MQAAIATGLDWVALSVFVAVFAAVTVIGFLAGRWRRGDLVSLEEWGLAGRGFGTLVTWFLVGGDLYTAYTFIAVPALVYGVGAQGFFALPYTIVAYPIAFLFLPRLWTVARAKGLVTGADFVQARFGNRWLTLAIALTGILATMPYIALQLVGLQAVLAAMGLGNGGGWQAELPLLIAFAVLAAYTYSSGLRAPALIAFIKDTMIYIVVIVAVVAIPIMLGGFGAIFDAAQAGLAARPKPGVLVPGPAGYSPYATLALGSAMALFIYPHATTAILSASSAQVIRRNMVLLPAYSFLLGIIALLGYMAIAAGIHPATPTAAVPLLFKTLFPSWFAGFAFAAIGVGALVPAAIMSIGAANLFTRNVWRAHVEPAMSHARETAIAKLVSLLVKFGALLFVELVPSQFAIELQLLGGIWTLQTFPAIALGLFTRWLHDRALLAGWAIGMGVGTAMAAANDFQSAVYSLDLFGTAVPAYAGLFALAANLASAAILTGLLRHAPRGPDLTDAADYRELAVAS